MNKESLELVSSKIIELLVRINNLDEVDRVELMLNIDKFLSPKDYENNIKVLKLVQGNKFQRRDIDETNKHNK